MSSGTVEFSCCILDVLTMLAEPDCKTRIVTFDNDTVRISSEKPRHLSGMKMICASVPGHRWFTLQFKPFPGMNSIASFRLFRLNICALVKLTPELVDNTAVWDSINQMVEQHRASTTP